MNAERREGTTSFRWRCCRVEANPELLPTQAVAKESTLLELPSPTIELLSDSSALSAVGSEVSQAWKLDTWAGHRSLMKRRLRWKAEIVL
mmetsp:Transcript_37957/g.64640  ORF Transcript_37957/g.64640 Transcript_37957/m.64640 type:complete len:90 (+) Transcript_37957:735-1004(+)